MRRNNGAVESVVVGGVPVCYTVVGLVRCASGDGEETSECRGQTVLGAQLIFLGSTCGWDCCISTWSQVDADTQTT
jgi:hypothetical protein